jgi:hypothetical protein
MELLADGQSIGYLLKSRVTDVADFVDTWGRTARGASVVDPARVSELVAEGASNAGIAHCLWVTEGTVEKHVQSILTKLNLPEHGDDHRRALAVVTFLECR